MAPTERNLSGWLPDRPDHRDLVFSGSLLRAAPPGSGDVSAFLNPPTDQGALGSCVGNSATSACESIYHKKGEASVDFSRLFVYWYARQYGGFPTNEDTGCYIRDAVKVLAKLGTPFEVTWPYDISKFRSKPPSDATAEAANHQVLKYFRCLDMNAIKTSIGVDGYAVVGGFAVPASIYSAETSATGVVKYPGPGDGIIGGHAVIFVAYDDATRLLKFQNSWGADWGASGYGFLPYEFIERGLADDFWTLRDIEVLPPIPPAPRPRPRPAPVRRRPVRRRRFRAIRR